VSVYEINISDNELAVKQITLQSVGGPYSAS
jgi:hypothetical protein